MIKDGKSYEVSSIQRRKGMIKSVKQEWLKWYDRIVYMSIYEEMRSEYY